MRNLRYVLPIILTLVLGILAYSIFNSRGAVEDEDVMVKEPEILAGNQTKLYEFSEAQYDLAKSSDKLVVLYFYANWCPICREEFPKMQSAFDELSLDNVVGFRVNFKDDETSEAEESLAREFGVVYQHTKVFIKDGEKILKAPDSWSKERYLEEINKVV